MILQYVQSYRVVNHCSTSYKLVSEWSCYIRFSVSHLALVRASTDGRSFGKLKITLAALQCSLSSESKSSEQFMPPHTDILYVTAGIKAE